MTSYLPTLSAEDIAKVADFIQRAYAPTQNSLSPEDQRKIQNEFFEIQKRPEAWGLVVPFLEHTDPTVQFFGAHTAQIKIVRDWDTFPAEHRKNLRDMLLNLTAFSCTASRPRNALRKLFQVLSALGMKLAPLEPTEWPDWLMSCITTFSERGVLTEDILDFLAIVAEEIDTADLLAPKKIFMQKSMLNAVPVVINAIMASIGSRAPTSPRQLISALKCFQAWIHIFPGNDLTPLIPHLILLLSPINTASAEFDGNSFVAASDALQEVVAKSALSDGGGAATLTEPLLFWSETWGQKIVSESHALGMADEVSHSLCKLLSALGEHSQEWLAKNLANQMPVNNKALVGPDGSLPSKSQLVQSFLKVQLAYTGMPGVFGVDEDESEIALQFWYLFQEALWNIDWTEVEWSASISSNIDPEKATQELARAVYKELVQILRRKIVWPERDFGWTKDQRDKFQVYRRDVGDTLINAYFILRDDMLSFLTDDLIQRLNTRRESDSWAELEADIHCLSSIQEAVPPEDNPYIALLFGPTILGRLPITGVDRIRASTISLIGAYATWFRTQLDLSHVPSSPSPLMNAVSYVINAMRLLPLCWIAANALRDLCDANRVALAPHINSFAELYAGLTGIPDEQKSKVLQSIASVIQALPPAEAVSSVEAIVSPLIQELFRALQMTSHAPTDARAITLIQLQALNGVAKGLTRINDSLAILEDSPEEDAIVAAMARARSDPRMVRLRNTILEGVKTSVELWANDAEVCDALSDLIKSLTSLPYDMTLLSLPSGPILEIVCRATQIQLTAVWLSLAQMLVRQLDPPTILPVKTGPDTEARNTVARTMPLLLQTSFTFLSQPGAMESNPDIVQALFGCLDVLSQHFVASFYTLPPGLFETIMQCAISTLTLQERYSLIAGTKFLGSLINRTAASDELVDAKALLAQMYGQAILRAILFGFAGVAPRSATANLIELLTAMVMKWPGESKIWATQTLNASDFPVTKANSEAKNKFVAVIFGQSTRSIKRIREASQEFTLMARGLEGSAFGYASM